MERKQRPAHGVGHPQERETGNNNDTCLYHSGNTSDVLSPGDTDYAFRSKRGVTPWITIDTHDLVSSVQLTGHG